MRKRWKDRLIRPTWSRKPAQASSRTQPRHRPLAVEQIEDRLMLSAVLPSVEDQGGFVDLDSGGFDSINGMYVTSSGATVLLGSLTGTPASVTTPQGGGVPVQQPEMVPIGSEDLAATRPEGGMIDLTRARRGTMFAEINRPLLERTGMENVAATSADVDQVIVAAPTPTATDAEISFAVLTTVAQPESSQSNEPVRASFSVPTLERIGGSRGRSRAFELAIGLPAATARDEYFTKTERFPSGHSLRDRLAWPTDSPDKTAEPVSGEEPDQEAYPARRENVVDEIHLQGARSDQKVDPAAASADVSAACRKAVLAQIASTEGDVPLPGVFFSKKRPVEVVSVLTVVAVGHRLATCQRQRSDTHPRRILLPRRRRPL